MKYSMNPFRNPWTLFSSGSSLDELKNVCHFQWVCVFSWSWSCQLTSVPWCCTGLLSGLSCPEAKPKPNFKTSFSAGMNWWMGSLSMDIFDCARTTFTFLHIWLWPSLTGSRGALRFNFRFNFTTSQSRPPHYNDNNIGSIAASLFSTQNVLDSSTSTLKIKPWRPWHLVGEWTPHL